MLARLADRSCRCCDDGYAAVHVVRLGRAVRGSTQKSLPVTDRAVELLRELRALPVGTLAAARALVMVKRDEGVDCPCCDQFAKIYRRKLNSSMARSLVHVYRFFAANDDWLHAPSYLTERKVNATNDFGLLRHWGLVVHRGAMRDDGSDRDGFYKITDLGQQFVEGGVAIPKFIYLYSQQLLGLSDGVYSDRKLTTIRESLGSKFNYRELMGD